MCFADWFRIMTIYELYTKLDGLYEPELSASWDNDGVMVTDNGHKEITKLLISLDPTIEAMKYAVENGFNTLLTHHPLIFKSLRGISPGNCTDDRVIYAMKNGLSVLSFHTRLDGAFNGVNYALARAVGYEPKQEVRLEYCEADGVVIDLGEEMDADEFALKCKKALKAPFVRVTGKGKIRRVICVGGAGKDFAHKMPSGDALLTGECTYNASQNAAEEGMIVIEAGHYETEAPICSVLKQIAEEDGVKAEIYNSLTQRIL